MLVTESLCWWLFGKLTPHNNVDNRSPTSVSNIDVATIAGYVDEIKKIVDES